MILTGKAYKAFKKYYYKELVMNCLLAFSQLFWDKNTRYLYAEIIEWLDSVGIYIEVGMFVNEKTTFYSLINTKTEMYPLDNECDSRQTATEAAIKLANEIYNNEKRN